MRFAVSKLKVFLTTKDPSWGKKNVYSVDGERKTKFCETKETFSRNEISSANPNPDLISHDIDFQPILFKLYNIYIVPYFPRKRRIL